MKKLFLILSLIFISLSSFASGRFDELSKKAIWEGEGTQTIVGLYMTLSFKYDIGNEGDRFADYFSAVGVFSPEGDFLVSRHEFVQEVWMPQENGHTFIDQWLFRTDDRGVLIASSHYFMEKDASGSQLQNRRLDESDEVLNSKWKEVLEAWYHRYSL